MTTTAQATCSYDTITRITYTSTEWPTTYGASCGCCGWSMTAGEFAARSTDTVGLAIAGHLHRGTVAAVGEIARVT